MANEKFFLIPIIFVFFIGFISESEAKMNFEELVFQSNDGNIILDFGKNKQQGSTEIPTIDFGIVRTTNNDYYFDISNKVEVNVYGNSFVLKSIDNNPVLIYAQNIGGTKFMVNVYSIDKGFKKQSFEGSLAAASEIQAPSSEKTTEKTMEKLPEMKILVKHSERVYWQYSYFMSIKVFDAKQNLLNSFDQNYGYLSGIDVTVDIFGPQGNLLKNFSGKTGKFGEFDVEYNILRTQNPRGTYTVTVTTDNGQDKLSKSFTMFVLGDQPTKGM